MPYVVEIAHEMVHCVSGNCWGNRERAFGDPWMLNASALPDDVALCGSDSRSRMLEILLSEFRTAFAGIEYEVYTQTRTVNAQAFSLGGDRFVRLYGGLALHPSVSEDALVFTLLHETGHHRASGRRFAGDPGLACDCRADKWALEVGATVLRRCSGRVMKLSKALDSLDAIIMSIEVSGGQVSAASRRRSQPSQACWAGNWPTRRSRLSNGSAPVPTGPCYYCC
jgi:hypothetical protein